MRCCHTASARASWAAARSWKRRRRASSRCCSQVSSRAKSRRGKGLEESKEVRTVMKTKAAPSKSKATLMMLKTAALAVSFLALASAVVATGGAAQSTPSPWLILSTLPVKGKGCPARLAPVVETEHAFAQYSIDHGMKDAFINFAAPDGVLFRRGPINAVETWKKRNPAPAGLLT